MSEIVVRRHNDRWGAFVNDRCIAVHSCRPCVVKVIQMLTKESERYTHITVLNEDGSPRETISTGVNRGRTTQEDLS